MYAEEGAATVLTAVGEDEENFSIYDLVSSDDVLWCLNVPDKGKRMACWQMEV